MPVGEHSLLGHSIAHCFIMLYSAVTVEALTPFFGTSSKNMKVRMVNLKLGSGFFMIIDQVLGIRVADKQKISTQV